MSFNKLKVKTKICPKSRLAVEVVIPADRCQATYDEALTNLSRSLKLPGFRKGKVPKAVLIQQVGLIRIKATALEKLVDKSWKEAIKEESIEALCEPELSENFEALLEKFSPNEDLTINLETDVAPKPKLKVTEGLTAEIETISFDKSKIDELIEQSRKELATLIPIDNRGAELGDIAVISFKGTYKDDGQEIEGGSSESMDLDLEKGRMIEGFIEGIIGMNAGEEKKVICKFPEDYPNENARGRDACFEINLKELKSRELPVLDDSFAKQASDKENMEELRLDLEKRLKADVQRRDKNNRQEALLKALINELEVEIPETLIQEEIRFLIEQTASKFAEQGMDVKSMFTPELVKSLMESSREEAEENVKKALALKALADDKQIKPTEEEIDKKFDEIKGQFAKNKNLNSQKLRQAVIDDLQQNQLLEWLESNSIIKEKKAKEKSIKNKSDSKKAIKKEPKD